MSSEADVSAARGFNNTACVESALNAFPICFPLFALAGERGETFGPRVASQMSPHISVDLPLHRSFVGERVALRPPRDGGGGTDTGD